jgi:hypothetical protein
LLVHALCGELFEFADCEAVQVMGGLCLRHAGRCGRRMRCDEERSNADVFGGLYRR